MDPHGLSLRPYTAREAALARSGEHGLSPAQIAAIARRAISPGVCYKRAPLMQVRPTLLTLSSLLACGDATGTASEGSGSTSLASSSFGPGSSSTGASSSADATGVPTTTLSGGSSESTSATDSSGDPTGGPPMTEDEILLRRAIAGEVDPIAAMETIAGRGGLPVLTGTGSFLFACLCGPGAWNLAGDHNNWTPDPMQDAPPLWWIEAEIAQPDGSLYKFHEPGSMTWVADPLGRRYGFDEFGRYSLVRASAPHLERWYAIEDAKLGLVPRDLQVYVPQDGAFTHALYAHDGQNLFDPDAFWGGWHLDESTPPNLLVVGIDNTSDRLDEYTPVPDTIDGTPAGGDGPLYAELVDSVIRPRMEAAYGPAQVTGTMGSSLGGLISLVIADLYPDRYAMAISMSGTLGWGSLEQHNETILERYAAAGKRDFWIYLDSGGEGPCADLDMDGVEDDTASSDNYCETAQMLGILESEGYQQDVDLFYVYAPGAQHNEAEWAARVGVPLQRFMDIGG